MYQTKPAVVLPFPLPVLITTSPFRTRFRFGGGVKSVGGLLVGLSGMEGLSRFTSAVNGTKNPVLTKRGSC